MNIYQVFDKLKKEGTDLLGISIETGISIYDLREVARDISKNPSMEIINKISHTYNYEVQYIYGVPHFFPKGELEDHELEEMERADMRSTVERGTPEEFSMIDYLKQNNITTLDKLKESLNKTPESPDDVKQKFKILKKLRNIQDQISDIEKCFNSK